MTRNRLNNEQSNWVLCKNDAVAKAVELAHNHGIPEASHYAWMAKFGRMDVSDAKQFRAWEHENSRLKKLWSDAAPDNSVLKEMLVKEDGRARRQTGRYVMNF